MTRIRIVATVVACAALLAGCAQVVSGTGANGPATGPVAPSTPVLPGPSDSGSGGTSGPPTDCPRVVYPAAQLSFDCITSDLKRNYEPNSADSVWPFRVYKTVEASSGWVLEEGAGHLGSPRGTSLAQITAEVRQAMVAREYYGARPGIQTVADRAITVDGAPAHLLQTTFTINPTWSRDKGHTNVKQEKLWIIAIEVAPKDVSLWYTSLPDLVSSLWSKVPATISSIQVG
ncbi:MAG TPA: hypothetical protein VE442_19045 [Jatrophihabitans sp.]|jgi:hypothetical protein|nr:hypothetical protein [Jatrophihabitans sp.]